MDATNQVLDALAVGQEHIRGARVEYVHLVRVVSF